MTFARLARQQAQEHDDESIGPARGDLTLSAAPASCAVPAGAFARAVPSEPRHFQAKRRQPVVAPSRIVFVRLRPRGALFDEAALEQPLDSGVERARCQLHLAPGAVADVLNDGVAVEVLVGQGQENLEDRNRER